MKTGREYYSTAIEEEEVYFGSDDGAEYHVLPKYDCYEHEEKATCWCNPVMDYRDLLTQKTVWVHRCIKETLN